MNKRSGNTSRLLACWAKILGSWAEGSETFTRYVFQRQALKAPTRKCSCNCQQTMDSLLGGFLCQSLRKSGQGDAESELVQVHITQRNRLSGPLKSSAPFPSQQCFALHGGGRGAAGWTQMKGEASQATGCKLAAPERANQLGSPSG